MKKEEIVALLNRIICPVYQIEADLGMPKTTLQKAIKGERKLPKKWAIKLQEKYGGIPELRTITPMTPQQAVEIFNLEHPDQNISIHERHPLWKQNDPAEGTMAFMMKYNCSSYAELENSSKNNQNEKNIIP